MSNPIDTSISLAYARFVGRTETILAADRSDAWKVEQTRDALARMDAEIAAIRRLADKPADPMTPRSIYDRWADASSPEAVNVTSMPTGHGTARGESTGTRTLCGRCGQPIERIADPTGDYWAHVDVPRQQPHAATPTPTWGETNSSNDSEGGVA